MIYQFEKLINFDKLSGEILASPLKDKFQGIVNFGLTVKIVTEPELTPFEEALLNDIVASHTIEPSLAQIAKQKREEAQVFGRALFNQFIEENIALGITQLGLTKHVRAVCRGVSDALTSGSLYDAIDEIAVIPSSALDNVILTPDRLLYYRNKIEQFLNITLSTEWNQTRESSGN